VRESFTRLRCAELADSLESICLVPIGIGMRMSFSGLAECDNHSRVIGGPLHRMPPIQFVVDSVNTPSFLRSHTRVELAVDVDQTLILQFLTDGPLHGKSAMPARRRLGPVQMGVAVPVA